MILSDVHYIALEFSLIERKELGELGELEQKSKSQNKNGNKKMNQR